MHVLLTEYIALNHLALKHAGMNDVAHNNSIAHFGMLIWKSSSQEIIYPCDMCTSHIFTWQFYVLHGIVLN